VWRGALTDPQALTHAEMAERLSRALRRQVAFVDIPPEAMRDALRGLASGHKEHMPHSSGQLHAEQRQ
jgi:uncharacterized protein YbjT (DUF2867 family)